MFVRWVLTFSACRTFIFYPDYDKTKENEVSPLHVV